MKFYNNLDLKNNEIQNFRVQNLAAAPENPVLGQHYFNTVDNTEYVYNGTKWVDALSQGDYTFKNGIKEENREVFLTAATADAIGGVTIGTNIDVEAGKISVKDAAEGVKGLIAVATDVEAETGTDTVKAINAKQLKAVKDAADTAIAEEKDRADKAEKANAAAIKAEETRADEAEKKIAADLAQEITDARAAEKTLTDNLAAEIKRAGDKETEIEGKVDTAQKAAEAAQKTANAAVVANEAITGATHTKITYDEKGLVTGGADLAETDIPDLHLAKVTDVTATAAEVNELHEAGAVKADFEKLHGITATAAELNFVKGVTSAIQDQLDAKLEAADVPTKISDLTDDTDTKPVARATADKDGNAIDTTYVKAAKLGVANGVATLDDNGLVPAAQLPSYVDDVVDLVAIAAEAPATAKVGEKYFNTTDKKIYVATAENTWGNAADPEADKIYVNIANNMSYRWSGTTMVQIGADKLKGFNGTITGDATTTTFTLNHNLGTRNVVCEIYDAATYEKVYVNVIHTSTTAIQAIFSMAPAVGENFIVTIIAIG